jgi:HlyD family secretion protein
MISSRVTVMALFICSSLLLACHHKASVNKNTLKTCVVEKKTLHHALHFTGTIKPLHESTLSSTMDAVVESMPFHYGQRIKKGEVVFVLNSAELQRQYHDTLTDYLKAKDSYAMAKARFTGTKDLWAAGLLSKNNYLSEQSTLNTARVTLMQATGKLSEMLEKMGEGKDETLSGLSFEEFDKVRVALTRQHNLIQLKAPEEGVLLYPPKTTDNTGGRLSVGTSIKAGQVLALIGDLNGVSIDIDVPEVDISEIKIGMPATIHGVAFGKEALQGTLIAMNAQASMNSNAGLPSFTAVVEVHALTKDQQSRIKVGMSATVELVVESEDKLLIPINAVKQEYGKSSVLLDTGHQKPQVRTIITGPVHEDSVVIESGLSAGDVIVCP